MGKKKHFTERVEFIRNAVLAFYVAVVLLAIEAIRFFIGTLFDPVPLKKILAFFIPWGIAIILLTFLIIGFSNSLKKSKEEPEDMRKKKKRWYKHPVAVMLGEYFWIIGLSLVVVGATKLFDNPVEILGVGVFIVLVGVVLKAPDLYDRFEKKK